MNTYIKWLALWLVVYFVPMIGDHFVAPWSLYEQPPLWVDCLWWIVFASVTAAATARYAIAKAQ